MRRGRFGRAHRITFGLTALTIGVIVLIVVVFGPSASWPAIVAVVQNEITTACQNPNVVSPSQVNFACDKATNQILWVFSLMTSGDNPSFSDAKSGRGAGAHFPDAGRRRGLVPQPASSVRSVQPDRQPRGRSTGHQRHHRRREPDGEQRQAAVQAGLESNPANCARYTGSAAVVTRAGYPNICASPVTSASGQAALVADVYQQWSVGASRPSPRTPACCSRTPATRVTRRSRPSSRACSDRRPSRATAAGAIPGGGRREWKGGESGAVHEEDAVAAGHRAGQSQHVRPMTGLAFAHGAVGDLTSPTSMPVKLLALNKPNSRPRRATMPCGRRSSAPPSTTYALRRASRRLTWRR